MLFVGLLDKLIGSKKFHERILNPDYGRTTIIFSEFERNKKISPEEWNKQTIEVSVSLMNLLQRENVWPAPKTLAHTNTKSLNKKGVGVVLDFLKAKGNLALLYGSYTFCYQVLPKFRRTPRDINIALNTDRNDAEEFTNELLDEFKKMGQNVRLSPYWPLHIQSFSDGKWMLAVDVHFEGMPRTEEEWQYYPKEDTSRGKTEKEAKLIDLFDTYALMATGIEHLKKNPSKKTEIEQTEKLISRWRELYSNMIDFKNSKIIKHPDLTI